MKTIISYCLLIGLMVCSSTIWAQQHSPKLKEITLKTSAQNHTVGGGIFPVHIKITNSHRPLILRLKGSFKIKKEYWSPTDFVEAKSITITIQPYKIHSKSKPKSI